MRSIIILSVLLFAVAVLARKDDVACVVHSDDCGKCVSNGCNWCSDGYCVSTESDMCEASKVSTQCGAAIVKPVHKRIPTTNPCESNYKCSDCAAAGCIVCVDANTKIFKCSHDNTCQTDAYGAVYERWIDRVVPDSISSFTFLPATGNACPPRNPAAPNSPEIRTAIQVVLNQFGDFPISFLEAKILGALKPIFTPPTFNAQFLAVTATASTKKRQGDTVLADVRVKFADAGSITAQGIAATIIANNPATFSVSSGTITALPYLPSAGSGQAVSPTTAPTAAPEGFHSKGINISKGALAGIIIGCVLGGALLIAIVAWFILRRRDAYPQAFRSPAAAYRP